MPVRPSQVRADRTVDIVSTPHDHRMPKSVTYRGDRYVAKRTLAVATSGVERDARRMRLGQLVQQKKDLNEVGKPTIIVKGNNQGGETIAMGIYVREDVAETTGFRKNIFRF